MKILTEPAGCISLPLNLIEAVNPAKAGAPEIKGLYNAAMHGTFAHLDDTGWPVATDGAQRKHHSFRTNCVHGRPNASSAGWQSVCRGSCAQQAASDGRAAALHTLARQVLESR